MRVDLCLVQRQVADMICIRKDSICNGEKGAEPELRFMPKIIEFQGYVSFAHNYKRINGLTSGDLVPRLAFATISFMLG